MLGKQRNSTFFTDLDVQNGFFDQEEYNKAKKSSLVEGKHPCYKTDFLFAKRWDPEVTLGILLWILNEHSVKA